MKKIKNAVLSIIGQDNLRKIWILKSYFNKKKYKAYLGEKKIIYALSPRHGNMGDQAIAYAALKFLQDNFSEYKIIELEREEIYKDYFAIKSVLEEEDIIVLHGGGNMGNLYIQEEIPRRFIIDKFRDNKIVSMTQTISFTNDNEGKLELKKTKEIYNSNENIIFLAREEKSYYKMKEILNHKIILVPDIVFYLEDLYTNKEKREGIMTCLRSDKESIWCQKKEKFYIELKENYQDVFIYDTVVDYSIPQPKREDELKKMWLNFKKREVVITDRLHGMIFAAITRTPCIVLKSLDHKVNESYKWISDVNFIRFVDELEFGNINNHIEELRNISTTVDLGIKNKYHLPLVEELKKF